MPDAEDAGGPFGWVPMDTLYITPDLGWALMDEMLDPALNSLAISVSPADLTLSSGTFFGYLGPNHRVLDVAGVMYEIPYITVASMYGHGMLHYYRYGADGEVKSFYLLLGASKL